MDNHVTILSIHFIETTGHQDWSEVCADANALAPLFKEAYDKYLAIPFKIKPTPQEGVLDIDGKQFKMLSICSGILGNCTELIGRTLFSLLKELPKRLTPQNMEEEYFRHDWSDEFCRQYGCFLDFYGILDLFSSSDPYIRLIRCPDCSTWFDGKPEDEKRHFFDIAKEKLYMLKLSQDLQSTDPK